MGDYPRRRQHKSCDQCRQGKRRCDVTFTPQLDQVSNSGSDDYTAAPNYSACSNCIKWRKECTIDWVRTHEQRRAQEASRKGRTPIAKTARASKTSKTSKTAKASKASTTSSLGDSDYSALGFDHLSPGTLWSNLDPSAFDIGTILGSMLDEFVDQHPLETVNSETSSTPQRTSGRLCQDFSNVDGSCFSSLLEEIAADHDEPPGLQSQRSQWASGESDSTTDYAPAVRPGGSYQENPPQKRRRLVSEAARDVGSAEPTSFFSSHYLAEQQGRSDMRNGLLKIYFDFLEDRMSCWIVEKNCPFNAGLLADPRTEWSSSRSNRMVTRVCKLDEALSRDSPLSKADRKQASKSLALAMMTLATQWAHLVNGEHENCSSQHGKESGLDNFERRLQMSLWQQANQALGEALANPSFKVIYASIIFSLTERPPNVHGEFMPSKPDLAALHRVLDRDLGPTYLDIAVRKLHQHQRGEVFRRAGHPASKQAMPLSPEDQRTYAVVLWMAVMFDNMSAVINGTSFLLRDADTDMVYGEFIRSQSVPSPTVSIPDDQDEIIDEPSPRPESDLWGDYFLSRQTPQGVVRMQSTRWPCSFVDAASCLADGIPVLTLFYRRIGKLQNLYYRRAPLKKVAVSLDAAFHIYHHWNATYGLFLEDCVLHHHELSSRIQSWYVLLSSNFNMGMLILADLIDKLDAEHMTIPSTSAPMQSFHCATSIRFRAACAISDLARICCSEHANLQFSDSLGVHSAIDQAALLRECWPTVLTRSLTYASEIFVKLVQLQKDLGPSVGLTALNKVQARLDNCINALWLLGRKSDLAACASEVLRHIVHP